LFKKVLASAPLSAEEAKMVLTQIEQNSNMVSMIFKFYLQSGETEFFVRRLRNLVMAPTYVPPRSATQEKLVVSQKPITEEKIRLDYPARSTD
jgi:hypothetical protein